MKSNLGGGGGRAHQNNLKTVFTQKYKIDINFVARVICLKTITPPLIEFGV